nr:hypothetical protein BaRGS_034806 [Batillaria attramentaria]
MARSVCALTNGFVILQAQLVSENNELKSDNSRLQTALLGEKQQVDVLERELMTEKQHVTTLEQEMDVLRKELSLVGNYDRVSLVGKYITVPEMDDKHKASIFFKLSLVGH